MALTDRDLQEVGRYVQAHLIEWLPEPLLQLNERAVRVEEELRSQRELMLQGFAQVDRRIEETRADMNARLEQVDKRFEETRVDMNARFETLTHLMDKRFEDANHRFGDLNRRFRSLTWLISTGFVVLATLMSMYAFFL